MSRLAFLFIAVFVVQPPLVAQETKAKPAFDIKELNQNLKQLGFEPKALADDHLQITMVRDEWPVHIQLKLSIDNSKVVLDTKFAPIQAPEKIPAQAWQKLLKENDLIAPIHFLYHHQDQRIHLVHTIEVKALDAKQLREELERFDQMVRKTYPIWGDSVFRQPEVFLGPMPSVVYLAPMPSVVYLAPMPRKSVSVSTNKREIEAGPKPRICDDPVEYNLHRFRGTWEIIEIEMRGKTIPHEVIQKSRLGMIFEGNRVSFQSLNSAMNPKDQTKPTQTLFPEKTLTVQLDRERPRRLIDLIDDDDQIERGIFDLRGDDLILCFASSVSILRPTDFKSTAGQPFWKLTLKRQKTD